MLSVRLRAIGGALLGSFELIYQLDSFEDFCGVEVRVDDFQKEHAIAKQELDVVGTLFLQLLRQVLDLVVIPTYHSALGVDGCSVQILLHELSPETEGVMSYLVLLENVFGIELFIVIYLGDVNESLTIHVFLMRLCECNFYLTAHPVYLELLLQRGPHPEAL